MVPRMSADFEDVAGLADTVAERQMDEGTISEITTDVIGAKRVPPVIICIHITERILFLCNPLLIPTQKNPSYDRA